MKARALAITAASTLLVFACSRTPTADPSSPNAASHQGGHLGISALPPTILAVPATFVNPLTVPPIAIPDRRGPNNYTITMRQAMVSFGLPGGLKTKVWGYSDGKYFGYLGPTIVTTSGTPVNVTWKNSLPLTLPFLQTAYPYPATNPPTYGPHEWAAGGVGSAVPHLHGGHTDAAFDGLPDDWFLPGVTKNYYYRNDQPAATLWYHDHALGYTRLNVYAGLAGGWVVTDAYEASLNLPSGKYDIPLIIQDKAFNQDGSLYYPPTWTPEFFGNAAVVNGTAFPSLKVEQRKYRFRLVNGANARVFRLELATTTGANLPMNQIASAGGFLGTPVKLDGTNQLVFAPGERADVIVDFSSLPTGTIVRMKNTAGTPFKGGIDPNGGDPTIGAAIPEVMEFRVGKPPRIADTSSNPTALTAINRLDESGVVHRKLTLNENLDENDNPISALLGILDADGKSLPLPFKVHHEPNLAVTEKPALGSTEVWEFINLTEDVHPIHLHLVQFQVLDRRPIEVNDDVVADYTMTSPTPPDANETGWKDTVRANPGEVVRVIAKFDLPGQYVWHCHILEHEENDMMRPFVVVP